MSGGTRLPDWLDARVVPPDEIAALALPPWPGGDNRRHEHDGLVLVCDADGLSLELRDGRLRTTLAIDFLGGSLQYRAKINQARAEMLVRACGVPNDQSPWRMVDATAGLGRDAFLLAYCGADVTLLERHPVLAILLGEALTTLALASPRGDDDRHGEHDGGDFHAPRRVASRMHLVEQDAGAWLQALPPGGRPQVVYCDPMFPPRGKSAAVSGEMQVMHALVGATPDEGALLAAALRAATRRVVVKRPLRAEPLAAAGLEHIHPSYALEGRASRFDVYLVETLPL